MITYKVNVVGLEKAAESVANEAITRAQQRAEKAMQLLLDTISRKLNHVGSGRVYKSKVGGMHRASAPGEPPASDSYDLSNSFSYTVSRVGKRVKAIVESSLWTTYGRRQELGGTGGGAYIAPRPYIRPAMAETDARVQRILDGEED